MVSEREIEREILDQLDKCAADVLDFPVLNHGYGYPADVRLSAYRDAKAWAIFIEKLEAYNRSQEHEHLRTELFVFGNDVAHGPGWLRSGLLLTGDGPGGPLFDEADIVGQRISPSATDMTIRGKVVPITTDPDAYDEAGIELSEPPSIQGFELLRFLAPKHRNRLFATDKEIAERLGRRMPLLLRLDEWHHPDEEKPSDTECFLMLAKAIAADDASLYRPTEPPNTHWSNWPFAGSI